MKYSTRCAACNRFRRKCLSDCIFSPYFPSDNETRFDYVHKIFGASNVGDILQGLPADRRAEAADSLYYEACCRIQDPVYGCAGMITILHEQICNAQCELARIQAEVAARRTLYSLQHSQYHQQEVQNGGSNTFPDISSWFD